MSPIEPKNIIEIEKEIEKFESKEVEKKDEDFESQSVETLLKSKLQTYRNWLASLITLCCILAFISTYLVITTISNRKKDPEKTVLEELISKEYISNAPTRSEYEQGELKGLVSALKDPYSQYIPQEEQQKFNDDLNRRYQGIGVQFDLDETAFKIIKVLKNSPAERAGLEPGDKLLKIEGKDINLNNTSEIVEQIRGPEGSKIKLQFQRNQNSFVVELTREKIISELISLEIKQNIAIITISSFGEKLDEKMANIAKQIRDKSEIKEIIVDLRDNTGGYLNEAVEVISYFLLSDKIILQEKYRDKTETLSSKSKNPSLVDYPVTILTNGNTASASEVMIGALRDHRQIQLVGQKTYGKGVVQRLFDLQNNNQLKLTVAEWLSPNGQQINKKGFEPDIKITAEQDALEIALKNLKIQN